MYNIGKIMSELMDFQEEIQYDFDLGNVAENVQRYKSSDFLNQMQHPNFIQNWKNRVEYLTNVLNLQITCPQDEVFLNHLISIIDFTNQCRSLSNYDQVLTSLYNNRNLIDINKYKENPYIRDIKIDDITDGNFHLSTRIQEANDLQLTLRENEGVPVLTSINGQVPIIFLEERTVTWMSICTQEIFSMERPVSEATGNVLTLGLGLGYYTYMTALKEDVKSVTVIESEERVIQLFTKHILPQFKPEARDKIQIIHADAFKYMEEIPDGQYDYCFADIWQSSHDMMPYLKLLKICKDKNFTKTKISYWIEEFMLKEYQQTLKVELVYKIIASIERATGLPIIAKDKMVNPNLDEVSKVLIKHVDAESIEDIQQQTTLAMVKQYIVSHIDEIVIGNTKTVTQQRVIDLPDYAFYNNNNTSKYKTVNHTKSFVTLDISDKDLRLDPKEAITEGALECCKKSIKTSFNDYRSSMLNNCVFLIPMDVYGLDINSACVQENAFLKALHSDANLNYIRTNGSFTKRTALHTIKTKRERLYVNKLQMAEDFYIHAIVGNYILKDTDDVNSMYNWYTSSIEQAKRLGFKNIFIIPSLVTAYTSIYKNKKAVKDYNTFVAKCGIVVVPIIQAVLDSYLDEAGITTIGLLIDDEEDYGIGAIDETGRNRVHTEFVELQRTFSKISPVDVLYMNRKRDFNCKIVDL